MPRKKLIRHFEPRYGVSEQMLEVEGNYVRREHEDYLLLSTRDLKQRLDTLRTQWHGADEVAEQLLRDLNDRESLAWQCLILRDHYLMLELYATCLRAAPGQQRQPLPTPIQRVEEKTPVMPEKKVLPFSEWLFELSR